MNGFSMNHERTPGSGADVAHVYGPGSRSGYRGLRGGSPTAGQKVHNQNGALTNKQVIETLSLL